MDEPREETETEATARRCAALRERMQQAALRALPREKVAAEAEALGLPVHEALAQIPEEELRLAYDLAIHAGPPGRPRAVDRLGQRMRPTAEGEEGALVLRALQSAWFSVFRVQDAHPEAGLVLEDALLGGEAWVLDDALAEHAGPGTILALRLARVQGFAITCGFVVALDEPALEEIRAVLDGAGVAAEAMTADARFARLIYRRAIGVG
jgi:hypothetical protein